MSQFMPKRQMMPGQRPMPGQPPRKMMADGGMMGTPEPIGGPSAPPPAPPQMDPDADGDMDSPTIKPEAVGYHDGPQECGQCQYFSQGGQGGGGQCAVLKMEVPAEGGCQAFEPMAGGGQPDEDDQQSMPMDDGEQEPQQ